MAIEASADQVKYKCGCGKVTDTVQGWRGHRGFKMTPACAEPYRVIIEGIGEPVGAPPAAQSTDSLPPQGEDEPEIETPTIAPQMRQAAAPDEPSDTDSPDEDGDSRPAAGSSTGYDAPHSDPPKPPESYGALKPSPVAEKTVSYPVMARFSYDLYRARYAAYKGSFNDFMFDMFDCALYTIGLHPVGIWSEPMGQPPPGAIVPAYDSEGVDEMMSEMASAAA